MLVRDEKTRQEKTVTATKHSPLPFKTKGENLLALLSLITTAKILPLYFFSAHEWRTNPTEILTAIEKIIGLKKPLVVRSSAKNEDTELSSNAGRFLSLINISGKGELERAINQVISSYQSDNGLNQVLIQPMLTNVKLSGVAFGYDPNTAAPYFILNYDDKSGKTDTVTSGAISDLKLVIHHHRAPVDHQSPTGKVIQLIKELATFYGTYFLDIEFAIDDSDQLYLFQVRPLIFEQKLTDPIDDHTKLVQQIADKIKIAIQPHPYLLGEKTVFGIMPDWNPAEIIGVRPKPLSLTLYRELITNAIWAYQRDNYGYRNLRSFPLLADFLGLPYIDVRVSFNSFIPKTLPDDIANRLVDYYIQKLISYPSLHDKVEFDIVFSCYTFDLRERLNILKNHGFDESDCHEIYTSLITLTKNIIDHDLGLWRKDLERVHKLEARREQLFNSNLDEVTTLYWLIEDCKRYGTLPFAGLARAGFIAVQILKSMVNVGILTSEQYNEFLASTDSITSQMQIDLKTLDRDEFLKKYGHLRPGTYDILSPRYDDEPNLYFDWENIKLQNAAHSEDKEKFQLSLSQLQRIRQHLQLEGFNVDVIDLMNFMKSAIEAREFSKFIFTKNVSDFLKLLEKFCEKNGISKEDAAYIQVSDILSLYSTSNHHRSVLLESIQKGKQQHQHTRSINLPPLITAEKDVWSFELHHNSPNFITHKTYRGKVISQINNPEELRQAIVMIESADPGYDWIFSYDIGAFVTMYGGINSHMAIRAGELGIPAVIGVGQSLYNRLSKATMLSLDCANQKIIDISDEKTFSY